MWRCWSTTRAHGTQTTKVSIDNVCLLPHQFYVQYLLQCPSPPYSPGEVRRTCNHLHVGQVMQHHFKQRLGGQQTLQECNARELADAH